MFKTSELFDSPRLNTEEDIIELKLLVDRKSNEVKFAEAGKDFADILFGLLQLPIGSIIGLLRQHGMSINSCCLDRVFKSVEKLENSYFHSQQVKESLLAPEVPCASHFHTPSLLQNFVPLKQKRESSFMEGPASSRSTSPSSNLFGAFGSTTFTSFSSPFSAPVSSAFSLEHEPFSASRIGFGSTIVSRNRMGFVKEGNSMFMVMDDLTVSPISYISIFTRFKDTSPLEEQTVKVDLNKILELVKASFESDTVLTDVFMGKNLPRN